MEDEILINEILAEVKCQSRREKDANEVVESLYPCTEHKAVAKVGEWEFSLTHLMLAVIAFLLLLNLCTK